MTVPGSTERDRARQVLDDVLGDLLHSVPGLADDGRPAGAPAGSAPAATPVAGLAEGADLSSIESALRDAAARCDGLDALGRAALREELLAHLRRLGVRSPARLVDAALPPAPTGRQADEAQGRALDLSDAEPWPDEVDGAALLDDVSTLLGRYVVLPAGAADVCALWVAHTYCMDAWEHTGYLALRSPTRRCGKTTTLRVVEELARRALRADNVSPAALYRVIEQAQPTLVIDELDRVARDSDIWALINSGHTRGGAVLRCLGDDAEPRAFSTWAPKILAFIKASKSDIPDTVEDRSIIIGMQRRGRGEQVERLRSRTLTAETEPLRRRLLRWATDHREALGAARPDLPEALDDRAADCWEPLLAVAAAAGGRWPAEARRLAVAYSVERGEDEAEQPGLLALADVAELIQSGRIVADEYGLPGEDIVRELTAMDERPWRTWGRSGDGLSLHALGRLLRPLGIRSELHGPERRRVRRYPATAILSLAERYAEKRSSAQPAAECSASPRPARAERMSASEALREGMSASAVDGRPSREVIA